MKACVDGSLGRLVNDSLLLVMSFEDYRFQRFRRAVLQAGA